MPLPAWFDVACGETLVPALGGFLLDTVDVSGASEAGVGVGSQGK